MGTFSNVTLNLFQGPSLVSTKAHEGQWMLKQVQHDDYGRASHA